jgi:hypothetical protein
MQVLFLRPILNFCRRFGWESLTNYGHRSGQFADRQVCVAPSACCALVLEYRAHNVQVHAGIHHGAGSADGQECCHDLAALQQINRYYDGG